jgi:branched-subunit amino acid aminotransferase/4-amino-4-deoxychorismate lyase
MSADVDPLAYLNGRFLPFSQAALPLDDAGFVFGTTAVDNCRTFRHQIFRLNDHLERFRHSCSAAGIQQPVSDEELVQIAKRLIEENCARLNAEQELSLILFATPGPIAHYAGRASEPTLGLHTYPLSFERFVPLFREGASLAVPQRRHVPAACVDPRIKQRSRLHWWLAEQEVQAGDPRASALLLNEAGHVTETAVANFLLVRGGCVISPPREEVLAGISLRTVVELCSELGISFRENAIRLEECLAADEALLCNTSYCLAAVSRINGVSIPWPGPTYEKLMNAWDKRVGLDVRKQICRGR